MNTKAKIGLIVKILLVLVLTPIGVASFALDSTMTNSGTIKGNPFSSGHYQYKVNYEGASYNYNGSNNSDTYDDATDNLLETTDISGSYWKYARIFWLNGSQSTYNHFILNYESGYNNEIRWKRSEIKKGDIAIFNQATAQARKKDEYEKYKKALGNIGNYYKEEGKIIDSKILGPLLSDDITIQEIEPYKDPSSNNTVGTFYDVVKLWWYFESKMTENEYVSTINQIKIVEKDIDETVDLTNVNSRNLAYAISFFDRNDNTNYWPDKAQRVIWSEDTSLNQANIAYSSYADVRDKHSMADIKVSVDESEVGTYLSSDSNYIVVGPFHMSDHAYGEDTTGNVAQYSGKGIVYYPNCLGGLTDTSITIKNKTTGTETEISSYGGQFSICYNKEGTLTSAGEVNYASGKTNLTVPSQYKQNKVPYPSCDFYIKISKGSIVSADYLTGLKITARDTQSTGEGAYFNYSIQTKEWELTKETTYECNNCGATSKSKKTGTHDCPNWECETDQQREHHQSKCFVWKEKHEWIKSNLMQHWQKVGVYQSDKINKKNKPYKYKWYRCITQDCSMFSKMYKHITKENFNKNKITDEKAKKLSGKKCNCGCNAEIIIGVASGKHTTMSKDGWDIFIGVAQGEEGFISRYNKSEEEEYISVEEMKNSGETWYTEDVKGIKNHYHKPECYIGTKPKKSKDMECEKDFHRHYFKLKGKDWFNDDGTDGNEQQHECYIDGHQHTTKCYPNIEGEWQPNASVKYVKTMESTDSQDPLLVVENCSTQVYTKELKLSLDIQLKTDVSVYTHIDEVENVKGDDSKREYKNEIPNVNDPTIARSTDGACSENDRHEGTTNGVEPAGMGNTADVTAWRSEEWKNKENVAVIEAGDQVKYNVTIVNNDDVPINVKIEDVLPDNILKNNIEITRLNQEQKPDSKYSSKTIKNKTELNTSDFPGGESGYIKVEAKSWIMYCITVEIDTAENSYDTSSPRQNTVSLVSTTRADVDKNSPYYNNKVANVHTKSQSRNSSTDSFICKMYNVKVRQGIDKIYRKNGAVVNGNNEYIVDDRNYNVYTRWARGYKDEEKSKNPIYVENGDIIDYIVSIDNFANDNSPYYNPNKVTVSLKDILPTETAEVISIKGLIGKVGFTNCSNYTGKLEYYTSTNQITDFSLDNGQAMFLYIKVKINNSATTTYDYDMLCTNTVKIDKLTNINGKTTTQGDDGCAYCKKDSNGNIVNGGRILNNVEKFESTSSDYFRIKEYNVVIDKYIYEVQHAESRDGTQFTYSGSGSRREYIYPDGTTNSIDSTKEKNPVSVEYGDKVTYHIRIYNTTNDKNNYYVGRENPPYKQPQWVTVNIKDTLPEKYSELNVTYDIEKSSYTPNYTLTDNNRIMNLNNLEVPANTYTTIIVSLVVEEPEKYKIETNTAEINGPIKNINSYNIINNGKRLKVSDKYQLNDYNAKLDEYVYEYDASMEKYNIANGFTTGATGEIKNGTEDKNSYPNNKPLDVEKYEKATFATKVTNNSRGGELESKNATYAKYNTRVRPTEVTQTLDYGLQVKSRKVIWYNANGTQKQDITSSIGISSVDNKSKRTNTYTYKIKNDDIILSPGEFIVYYTTVEVTESNMCLKNLRSFSQIKTLTNINRNNSQSGSGSSRNAAPNHDRIITNQNIADKKSDKDYVRLKDLVIAGTVWLDSNKDGYNNNNELLKKEVVVKLYRTDQKNPVKTVKTNQNGFYTFGRQWKAKGKDKNNNYNNTEYIKYYVEFEYDGATYKATEVYGGNSTGNADGTGNLYTTKTLDWRQGYSDLPGTKTGKTEYLKDSNAYEFDDVRNKFNSEYQTIGFNKAYSNFNSTNTLSYTKNGHTSMLDENSNRTIKARSFIIQNYNMSGNGVQENLDNTKTLFLQDYSGHSNKYPETEYLKFINLGLVRREEVDISIESDVYSVKTTMNGEEMTYDFNKNDADSTKSDYSSQTNAYKLANAYNLNLYTADFNYRNDKYYKDENVLVNYKGNESELTAEVTYRMRITNNKIAKDEPNLPTEDIPVETAINEIAVYYDSNFISKETVEEYLKAQTTVKDKNDTTGLLENKIFNSIRVNYGTEEELNKGTATDIRNCISFKSRYSNNKSATDAKDKGYNVLYLTGNALDNTYLKEGESKYVQLTFVVDKAEINNVLRTLKITDNKDNNMGLEAVTEISAYTTKYSDSYKHKGLAGKYAGLIDRDSNPGNLNLKGVEDYDNYEDDKYKVGVTVGLLDSSTRTITGIVWDDSRSKNVGTEETGIQYLGNGEYNVTDTNDDKANTNPNVTHSNDKPISGVKVSLVEVVQTEDGKYYEYPARDSQGNLIETRTDENGKYTLKDYIPGYYKVRFDYGDDSTREDNIIYNGQDYKSTTYFNDNYYVGSYKTDNIGGSANFKYFDDVKESLKKKNKSDAQDDEIRRLNVNSYSETMTTTQAQVFSETSTHKNSLTKNTHMYSESTIFYAKPEERKSSEVNIDATPGDFNTTRLWNITDLDFGLEYRPEASVVLDKDIESLELVTSDNKTLVKLYFKEKDGVKVIDEGKSIGNENVQFMPNDGKNQQGFVYLNMDTDILEGCTIKVDYYMDSSNNSEVDRINQNLDNIRYEKGAVDNNYQEKVYISDNYNANGTAAQLLVSKYYDGYNFNTLTGKETFNYLKKLKKPYKTSNETTINATKLTGTEYYGMYLGETYYTGEVGEKDIVAKLKVDHILDYIDNDFTFSLDENNTENRMWQTTTTQELKNSKLLDSGKVHLDENENLIDKFGIRYDTDSRSNLALSVDDNKRGNYLDTRTKGGNASLSRFLNTKNAVKDVDKDTEEYTGTINAIATKVLSADDLSKGTGLSYDNLAEVVQYTSLTGRRTTLPNNKNDESSGGVVGNANIFNSWIGYESSEDDTDATEIITISPPTGLTQ